MDSALLISLLRTASAGAALVLVLPAVSRRLGPRLPLGMLGALALVALGCFFNLGRPQFADARQEGLTYVHTFDMRVYFPVAKYFRELRYDGLYLASVAALVDDDRDVSIESLGDVEIRDLRTHEMRHVRDVAEDIEAVRGRFTPERWDELVRDMRYFRQIMGPDYLASMRDHGGNATPVWLLVAHALFARASASDATFLASALLDPLLLILFGVVVARTFGVKTALVCLIVYGANDFSMFGTNWSGSTLRNDWMVALGLGAAALRRGRHAVGGALLSLSALLRAFPAMALVGLTIPPLIALVQERRRTGAWPTLRAFLQTNRGTVRALGAAAVTAVLLVALSAAVFSPASWSWWAAKAALLSREPHVNHLGLRSITMGTFGAGEQALRDVGYVVAAVVYTALALWALRGCLPHQAALVLMLLVGVYLYPANYYFHFVFLWPLLVTTDGEHPGDAAIFVAVLGVCVAELPAMLVHDLPVHFALESTALLLGTLAVLVLLARDRRVRRPFDTQTVA